MPDIAHPPHGAKRRLDPAAAGMVAGLVAGVTYLVAQMSFMATLMGGTGAEPLRRISALLLGPDILAPADGLTPTIVGMALLIHLPLAAVYGRLVGSVVRRVAPMWTPAAGMATGLLLFAFNFWILAPLAFPWFVESRHVVTAFDHALFGIVAAVTYAMLTSPRDGRA